jgi:hypothetical protein
MKLMSNRKTMATLSTTCADNSTTTASAHANKKTMGAFTAYNGWLVCTFHEKPLDK